MDIHKNQENQEKFFNSFPLFGEKRVVFKEKEPKIASEQKTETPKKTKESIEKTKKEERKTQSAEAAEKLEEKNKMDELIENFKESRIKEKFYAEKIRRAEVLSSEYFTSNHLEVIIEAFAEEKNGPALEDIFRKINVDGPITADKLSEQSMKILLKKAPNANNQAALERFIRTVIRSTERIQYFALYCAKNDPKKLKKLPKEAVAKLANFRVYEVIEALEDKNLREYIAKNCSQSAKDELINIYFNKMPIDVLAILNPKIPAAITKFELKKINGEYKRSKHGKTWPGNYYFRAEDKNHLYYRDEKGIQKTNIDGSEKWETVEKFESTKPEKKAGINLEEFNENFKKIIKKGRDRIVDPETGEVKFENKKQEKELRLSSIFPKREDYKLMITDKNNRTKIATFNKEKGEYLYENGKRAIFLNGFIVRDLSQEAREETRVTKKSTTEPDKLSRYQEENEKRRQERELRKGLQSFTAFKNSEKYLKKSYEIKDKKLIKYFDNDKLWNNLWAKRGEQKNEYIDGLPKITRILTNEPFNLKEAEIRDELRKVVQKWSNKKIDFEDIFDHFIARKEYKGSFREFKNELEDIKEYISTRDTDYEKLNELQKIAKSKEQKLLNEGKTKQEMKEFYEKDEDWKSYSYLLVLSGGREKLNEFNKKKNKLFSLNREVISPIAELLDAVPKMSIKVSQKENFADKYSTLLDGLSTINVGEIDKRQTRFNPLDNLTAKKDKGTKGISLEFIEGDEDLQKSYRISIANSAKTKFEKALPKGVDKNAFNNDEVLKLVFGLYTLESLVSQGCIKRIKGRKKLYLLTDLPKNFNKDNEHLAKLITRISDGSRINQYKNEIELAAASIDNNLNVLSQLSDIFGDKDVKTHMNWLKKAKGWFAQEDIREVSLSMSGIANKEVTMKIEEFLEQYSSPDAAKNEILRSISETKNGAEVFSMEKLENQLKERLRAGINFLEFSGKNDLKSRILDVYGVGVSEEEGLKKAQKVFEKKIGQLSDKPNLYLGESISELIKIGHVELRRIHEHRDKRGLETNPETIEDSLSTHPQIRAIQEQMLKNGKREGVEYSAKDMKKVEEVLLGGLVVGASTAGGGGVGLGTSFNLGDGWSLQVGAGVGANGSGDVVGGAGGGVSKRFELSKDGRTALTIGVSGSTMHVGGHASIDFPITEEVDMSVSGTGGATWIGFLAGGGLGWKKNMDAEANADWEKLQKQVGFKYVEQLINKNAGENEIADAICNLPKHGATFLELRNKYKLSNKGMVELYKQKRAELESSVVEKTAAGGATFEVIGGGVGAGVVNGIPLVSGYLTIKFGDELVVVRELPPGNVKKESDTDIQAMILEKFARKKVTFLGEKIPASGNLGIDAEGNYAILESGKQTRSIAEFASPAAMNNELKKIDMHLRVNPQTGLSELRFDAVRGNLKVIIDPALEEQLVLKDSKVSLTAGLGKDFIISRETFHYPFKKDGETTLDIVTIKKNPLRSRTEIEMESTNMIYKRKNYKFEIRKGVADTRLSLDEGQRKDITTYGDYMKQGNHPEISKMQETLAGYDRFKDTLDTVKPAGQIRERMVSGLVETLGNNRRFMTKYKKLSTQGATSEKREELVQLIENKALEEQGVENLSNTEHNEILTRLMVKSFSNIHRFREREKQFKKHLKFAEKVLAGFFEQTKQRSSIDTNFSGSEMSLYIIDQLKNTDLNANPQNIGKNLQFLSVVGTEKIVGMRGTPSYTKDLRNGILNFTKYSPSSNKKIERDIAKVLIETISPLDRRNNKEFMKSKLAVSLVSHPAMYLLLGNEDAQKVAECFKKESIEEKNKSAFDKFKKIVENFRDAQLSGEKVLRIGNFDLVIPQKIGMGVFKQCGNPTIIMDEKILIRMRTGVIVAGKEKYVSITPKTKRQDIAANLGLAIFIEEPKGKNISQRRKDKDGKNAEAGTKGPKDTVEGPTETPAGKPTATGESHTVTPGESGTPGATGTVENPNPGAGGASNQR